MPEITLKDLPARKLTPVPHRVWGDTAFTRRKGWFFQYAPWDLRIDCPGCDKWEFLFTGLKYVDTDGVVTDPWRCDKCGAAFVMKIEELTEERIASACAKERSYFNMGRQTDRPTWTEEHYGGTIPRPAPPAFSAAYVRVVDPFDADTPAGVVCDALGDAGFAEGALAELRKADSLRSLKIPQLWADLPEVAKVMP